MSPRKSVPKGIDPAYPNENFVKSSFINKGQTDDYYEYLWNSPGNYGRIPVSEKAKSSGYGHSIGQRAGKLRLSGTKGAHRIGKRG